MKKLTNTDKLTKILRDHGFTNAEIEAALERYFGAQAAGAHTDILNFTQKIKRQFRGPDCVLTDDLIKEDEP
jgi:hypothetical protein